MKVIHRKISLEPYKSRINGSLKSYNGDDTETFVYNKTKMNNYGMFPYDVIYNGSILSYPTLMERYNFCKKYNKMLEYDADCGKGKYKDAIDYYRHEVVDKNPYNESIYRDMDNMYAEYGGDTFFNWCNDILYGKGTVQYSDDTAHILVPILFTNTIDDMGEYSIFSSDWEEGEDYSSKLNSGTTVLYDDDVWQLKKGIDGYGSLYSNKYKELYFPNISNMPHDDNYKWYENSNGDFEYDENQWINNTEEYFKSSTNDYHIKPDKNSTYANKNGKIVFNPTPDNMSYPYEIIKNGDLGFYVINGILFTPFESEYVEYGDKKTPLIVYTIDSPYINEKYCIFNELKFYSKTEDNDPTKHYFEFEVDTKTYIKEKTTLIQYQDTVYKVENNKVVINNGETKITYNKIDGFVIIEGITYYVKDGNIVKPTKKEGTLTEYEYELDKTSATKLGVLNNTNSGYTVINNDFVKIYKPYIEFKVNTISGYTESKLDSFVTYNTASDDIGNILPGCLKFKNGNYEQPKENDILDLPYRVGNINNLTTIGYDENDKPNKWFGNILTSITFFYEDYYGNVIEDTKVPCNYGDSLLDKIEECLTELKDFKSSKSDNDTISKNHNNINDTMKCTFKYHMGAIIEQDGTDKYKVSTDEYEQGVVYEETVSIMKKQFMYYYDEFSSFPINYYDFEYDKKYITLNEYSNNVIETNQSKFSVAIDDLIKNTGNTRASYDGMIMSPVFREEYKFGVSMKENIESDIYIDRGVSSAFERHLNLLNVNSMESLEQFRKWIL